jgi:hypothetical protein
MIVTVLFSKPFGKRVRCDVVLNENVRKATTTTESIGSTSVGIFAAPPPLLRMKTSSITRTLVPAKHKETDTDSSPRTPASSSEGTTTLKIAVDNSQADEQTLSFHVHVAQPYSLRRSARSQPVHSVDVAQPLCLGIEGGLGKTSRPSYACRKTLPVAVFLSFLGHACSLISYCCAFVLFVRVVC